MKRNILIFVCFLSLAGCSPARDRADSSPVLAKVNGVPITARQFKARLEAISIGYQNISGGTALGGEAKADLLGEMVEEEMYLQEAGRLKISASDEEVEAGLKKVMADYPAGGFEKALKRGSLDVATYKSELSRKLVAEKLIESQVYSNIKIEQGQLRSYYEEHKADFRHPVRVRARQIVVENMHDAQVVIAELRRRADFAGLARKKSLSPDRETGGDLGYFSKGDMPQEFDVVFGMKPGSISPVVKTPYGYHVFKVEEIQKARDLSFEEAQPEVRKKLLAQTGEGAFTKWQEGLKARTRVEVNFDILGHI